MNKKRISIINPEKYNTIRRILFCTANNPQKGFSAAYDYLEKTYKKKMDSMGYAGMLAELKFYEKFGKEFKLTVAGDMGEHADFSGEFDRFQTRFDVTTNISFKSYSSYEPFLGNGIKYKIALYDKQSFEIVDILELKFQKCSCGGFIFPFILLLGENFNQHGESKWTNDQKLIKICNKCLSFIDSETWTHHFLYIPAEYVNNLPEEIMTNKRQRLAKQYYSNIFRFFKKHYTDEIVAVAQHIYKVTSVDGGGFWTFDFGLKNKAIEDELPENTDCGLL